MKENEVITGNQGAELTVLEAVETIVATNQDFLDGTTDTPDEYRRERGVTQIEVITINAAANAGVSIIGEIFVNPCLIESIVLHADAAQTGDLTSAAIEGGASQVIEFIAAADALQADLDAENKQVAWDGAVYLPVGGQITIDLQGTGATAVDLKVSIKYRAITDGGFLV